MKASLPPRIYLDLEYCFPGMSPTSGRPSADDKRQIVQIAAVCYDASRGEEIMSFDQLAIPIFEKFLPSFFTDLTSITQEMLHAQAIAFPLALQKFVAFAADYQVWTFNADWDVMKQNCEYFGIIFPFAHTPFTRVRSLLPGWGIDADKYSSGTLYQAAGLQMDGHVHNALHDVRSMAAAVHHFETK